MKSTLTLICLGIIVTLLPHPSWSQYANSRADAEELLQEAWQSFARFDMKKAEAQCVEAIKIFDSKSGIKSGSIEARVLLIRILNRQKRMNEAKLVLQEAIELAPAGFDIERFDLPPAMIKMWRSNQKEWARDQKLSHASKKQFSRETKSGNSKSWVKWVIGGVVIIGAGVGTAIAVSGGNNKGMELSTVSLSGAVPEN